MNIQSLLPISRFDVSSANMLDRLQQSSASIVSSIFHTDRVTAVLHSSSFHEYQQNSTVYGPIFPNLSIQEVIKRYKNRHSCDTGQISSITERRNRGSLKSRARDVYATPALVLLIDTTTPDNAISGDAHAQSKTALFPLYSMEVIAEKNASSGKNIDRSIAYNVVRESFF